MDLVDGIPTPLENMKVDWDDDPQYMEGKKHVPNHQTVTCSGHGSRGPFITNCRSYKSPFIKHFPWLCLKKQDGQWDLLTRDNYKWSCSIVMLNNWRVNYQKDPRRRPPKMDSIGSAS